MAANNLGYQFKMANVAIKIIVINALAFIAFELIAFIFQWPSGFLIQWFWLPAKLSDLLFQPWSLITYSFLHADILHILFNMLILYWFSQIVLNLFTPKRFLTIYFLGAISGAVFFILAYNLFPVFGGATDVATLQGASAAVMAITIFIAAYTPNTEVRVIFFNVKMWQLGVFLVVMDLVRIPTSGNAGGFISHLGGALFGYIYATQLAKGNDIGIWWENMIDGFATMFKKREKKSKMKTVYRKQKSASSTNRSSAASSKLSKSEHQRRIDDILDKISKSGYDSLSQQEKDFLFKAGKNS